MQSFEIFGGEMPKCPTPLIARLLCLIPWWRALIISCCQLQVEWTEPGWWLGLYLLAIAHTETTLLLQETVPNYLFNISTQGLQYNQIQCGSGNRCRFAINASFYKNDWNLSPTRLDSSARTFILFLLSMILVKRFVSAVKAHDLLYQRQQLYCVRHAPCLWNYLREDQLNFQSLWKVCYFLPYNMLCWKLEQWIERQFVHFVHSGLAIRECTKWANGLSIHCSSFQNVFLCYFKNIDSFFMCLTVFVLTDFFAQRS